MNDDLLVRYVEAGFPHLRQVSGLPRWLVPDMTDAAHELSDQAMLELADPLDLAERLKAFLARAPEPDSLTIEVWQQGIANWQPLHQVLSVTMALLRACEKVEALERRGALKIDFALVRGLAVTAYAPFAPNESEILSRLAIILGGSPAEPAGLLDLYITALAKGDNDILTSVDHCILKNPAWREWSRKFIAKGKALPFMPRIIGVSPPLTSGLMQVLINMVMEVLNADHSRNYPN